MKPMAITTRKHAAIMFTDIAGYTALMGSDENQAFEVLKKNREIHAKFIEQFHGTLIKEMGDGMLIIFDLASDAVRCAIDIQRTSKIQDIPLKIGIHEGEVIFDGDDILGDGVNIASRIQDGAEGGCIMISGSVYRDIRNKPDIHTEFVGEKKYKNVRDGINVYKVCNVESKKGIEINDSNTNSSNYKMGWLVIGIISIIVIILLVWNLYPNSNIDKLERSIVVRPFWNESDDPTNAYFVNGMADEIRTRLSKIADLKVLSRGSVEKYKDSKFSNQQIARELDVTWVLEGTVQKFGDDFSINVQLILGEDDDHVWSDIYKKSLSEVNGIFDIQNQIAQTVADEIQAVITNDEKQRIQQRPTTNIEAYTFFLKARQLQNEYWMDGKNPIGLGVHSENTESLDGAIKNYNLALSYDPRFGQAYAGLALAYWTKYFDGLELKNDSSLLYAKRALSIDKELEDAYYVKGLYFRYIERKYDEALELFQDAIHVNPNCTYAYLEIASIENWELHNYIEGLAILHKIEKLDRSFMLSHTLISLGHGYLMAGFPDRGIKYFEEAFEFSEDTIDYFYNLAFTEWSIENIQKAIEWGVKAYKVDSNNIRVNDFLASRYSFLGDFTRAYYYLERTKIDGQYRANKVSYHRVGYVLWNHGKQKEGLEFIKHQIQFCEDAIEKRSQYGEHKRADYDLAAIYAFLGEREKAINYLREVEKRSTYPAWMMAYFKLDPMLDNIREDPVFINFLYNAQRKFDLAHERVQIWLDNHNTSTSRIP